ncbi:uncharacterized protein LOC119777240 [Cyprinodon tularosa]|uniref:uncharacterized protein LOC119777240 n=1 Tax=Cyprinodon tularosa TaxID=77115 RepID=UPI0018E25ED7|nr:uncharacterized protein LOC119777240 [Cyprinodon tularosa]
MMERRPSAKFETQSLASHSVQASVSSRSNIVLLQAKAKAEAAQTRATFMKREAEIKLEQARLQAALDSLRADEELETARAEMQTLEAGLMEMGYEIRSNASSSDLEEATKQLVSKYVLEQRSVTTGATPYQMRSADADSMSNCYAATDQQAPINHTATDYGPPPLLSTPRVNSTLPHSSNGPPPVPAPRRSSLRVPDRTDYQSFNLTSDLAKFLARSHMVTSGLSPFDDKPINYWAWKASFKSAIAGLDLSATEELDLLVKYLGKDSAEQIKRIKAVNIRHPPAGLSLAWERLEETYGSPEAMEHALFSKVEKFPKVSSNDPWKLRDLADLLSELEYAKLDGSLPGLSYLDTARGIHPIVEKLPHNIQEKWISHGSKYKRTHLVSFPPFSVFVKFVLTEAKARTDPSFSLFASSSTPANVKKSYSDWSAKTPVAVHKTQVSSTGESTSENESSAVNPSKQCPIHQKPHPLKKCRGFRLKTMDERKQLLKKFSICFRCCSSTQHLARDCTAEIKCTECESDAHVSALHPGPAPWSSKASLPPANHGGEGDKADSQEVTSKCTQVCGEGVSPRACSKISLVNV